MSALSRPLRSLWLDWLERLGSAAARARGARNGSVAPRSTFGGTSRDDFGARALSVPTDNPIGTDGRWIVAHRLRGICKQHRHLIAVDYIVDALPGGALDSARYCPKSGRQFRARAGRRFYKGKIPEAIQRPNLGKVEAVRIPERKPQNYVERLQ